MGNFVMMFKERLPDRLKGLTDPCIALAVGVAALSLVPGPAAFAAACLIAGLLAGLGNRVAAAAAIAGAAALQAATWPEHFRVEAFSPIFSVVLAPIARRLTSFRQAYGIVIGPVLVGIGLAVAIERGFIPPRDVFLVSIAASCAVVGMVFGQLLASMMRRDAAWSTANIHQVARDLLLGRITTGMIHDLAQPINVVSMANGNLSYIITNMAQKEGTEDLLKERVERIAGQTDKAANLLHNFRSFGRAEQEPGAVLTVRDALERTRVATTSNVRHGGVAVEFCGDALDCIGGEHLGVLQVVMAGTLLSAFAGFTSATEERLNGSVVVDARLAGQAIEFAITALDDQGEAISVRLPDPVLGWLLQEILSSIGGSFATISPLNKPAQIRLALPYPR